MDSFDRLVLALIVGLLAALGGVILLGDRVGVVVSVVMPQPDSSPSVTSGIELRFSEGMDQASVESRFEIDPPLAGDFVWTGLAMQFNPDDSLLSGQAYTVTLSAGAVGESGRRTVRDTSWTFVPRVPSLLYLGPADRVQTNLYRLSMDGGEPETLYASPFGIFDYAPHPGGESVALSVLDSQGSTDIWMLDLATGAATQLLDCSDGGACSGPAWSPDGQLLAYERQEAATSGGRGPSRVWLYDLETDESAPVYEDNQVLGYTPSWSPDGGKLAFFDANTQAIRILTLGDADSILIPSAMGEVGSFSPDGGRMVYTDIRPVGRQYFSELWIADFESAGGILPLDEQAEEDQSASWSPDGKWIAFSRRRIDRSTGFGGQIMLLNLETEEMMQIEDDPRYNNTRFSWNPTSRSFVVQRFNLEEPGATPELWLCDVATGTLTLLAENAYDGAWLP